MASFKEKEATLTENITDVIKKISIDDREGEMQTQSDKTDEKELNNMDKKKDSYVQQKMSTRDRYIRGFGDFPHSRSLNSTPKRSRSKPPARNMFDEDNHFRPIQNCMSATDSEESLFYVPSSHQKEAGYSQRNSSENQREDVYSRNTSSSNSLSSSHSELDISWGSTMSEILRARRREKPTFMASRSLDASPIDGDFIHAVWIAKNNKSRKRALQKAVGQRHKSEGHRMSSTSSADSSMSLPLNYKEYSRSSSRDSSHSSVSSSSELDLSPGSSLAEALRARSKFFRKKRSPKLALLKKDFDTSSLIKSQGSTPLVLSSEDDLDEFSNIQNPLDVQLRHRDEAQQKSNTETEVLDGNPGLINILKARHNHLRF